MSWRTAPEMIPDHQIKESYRADVVVVGLGYAGTAAMRAAREEGASVIGLEMMRESRYVSFGRDVGHINSRFLKSRGVPEVDPNELFNEWMRRAGGRANPELVMKYCRRSGEAFDWFTDMYSLEELKDLHVAFWPAGGEKFKKAAEAGDNALHGYHFWVGTAQFPDPMGWPGEPTLQKCVKDNIDKAVAEGAETFFFMEAQQLIKEEGRVTGVIAKRVDTGTYASFYANKGVILAAGDFAGDAEMVADLCCDITDMLKPGEQIPRNFGRRGSGHRMGYWAGGRLESRPLPSMGGNQLSILSPVNFAPVMLNGEGKRFMNEAFGGTEIGGFAGNQMPRGPVYVLFDEHYIENELAWSSPSHGGFDANTPGALGGLQMLFEQACKEGKTEIEIPLPPPMREKMTIYAGKSPEELVKNAGLDGELAEAVVQNIARYNELCAKGVDEDFARDKRLMDPLTDMLFLQIAEPRPFGSMLVSVGGFVTDGHQQVLDENYERIPGLYASGNCCGRRFGSQYSTPIPGVSIGMALTLGREVGIAVANSGNE